MLLGTSRNRARTRTTGRFATTHWDLVLSAAGSESSSRGDLELLCSTYWYPLYAYLRKRGIKHEDAQDLTQGFLLQLLRRKSFARVDPDKGRFRSFLLSSLKYYLADERDKFCAQKRGGGRRLFSFDGESAARRFGREPIDERSPTKLFERSWAVALLERVLTRLQEEFKEAGKAALFAKLEPFLVQGDHDMSYAELATTLRSSPEAARKSVSRMRARYYVLFREEVARTVTDRDEIEDEIRFLSATLAA
jgi:RNA polymerase sigma-70 factor (ECF subfamily)